MAHGYTMAAEPDLSERFRAALERHRGVVLKVAASYCRDPHDRADLAQEIAAQLWHAFPCYDGTRAFSTWMYRIALNVAISFRRASGRRERHVVGWDDNAHDVAAPADDTVAGERIAALYRCIDRLDPLNRALLLLYLDERSQREIADILGLTETNVATKIGRLKQRLRADLSDASIGA